MPNLDHVPAASAAGPGALTVDQTRILHYLPTHLTFQQIADRAGMSLADVRSQVVSIYRRLGVASRTDAIERAYVLGLIPPTR